jgi:hypothetical protein
MSEQMYIAFHSFLVPSSPGKACHQVSTMSQFQAGTRSISFPLTNRAAFCYTESSWDIWFLLYGSHTALVCSCFLLLSEEADGTIGFGCDITGVICPAQVIACDDT